VFPVVIPRVTHAEEPAVIDKSNVEQFKDMLPYDLYIRAKEWGAKFKIIPTLNNFKPSKAFQEATKKNIGTCNLGPKGELVNYSGGTPFPDPKTGAEVSWNMERRYAGDDFTYEWDSHVMNEKGNQRDIGGIYLQMHWTGRTDIEPLGTVPDNNNELFKEYAYQRYPFEMKGTALLNVRYLDGDKEDDAWVYVATLRRVRRFPTAQRCDTYAGSDATWDDFRNCNWKQESHTYKYIGKKDLYISRHNEKPVLYNKSDYSQRTNISLEKAPVHIFEAYAKDKNYVYSKRVMYVDAESWYPVNQVMYDRKGSLWKSYHVLMYMNDDKIITYTDDIYDFQAKRSSMYDHWDTYYINHGYTPDYFSVATLRKLGR
jgi:hypothetical protein